MFKQYLIFITIVLLANSLKMRPPPIINRTNFHTITNVTIDAFLQNGSANEVPWFLLFKIPSCKHCQQSEMLFNSFYIEYHKRLHFEQPAIQEVMETNFEFGIVDWYYFG